MSCENLATKADINALNSKLDDMMSSLANLATKDDVLRIEEILRQHGTWLLQILQQLDELSRPLIDFFGSGCDLSEVLTSIDSVKSILYDLQNVINNNHDNVSSVLDNIRQILYDLQSNLLTVETNIIDNIRNLDSSLDNAKQILYDLQSILLIVEENIINNVRSSDIDLASVIFKLNELDQEIDQYFEQVNNSLVSNLEETILVKETVLELPKLEEIETAITEKHEETRLYIENEILGFSMDITTRIYKVDSQNYDTFFEDKETTFNNFKDFVSYTTQKLVELDNYILLRLPNFNFVFNQETNALDNSQSFVNETLADFMYNVLIRLNTGNSNNETITKINSIYDILAPEDFNGAQVPKSLLAISGEDELIDINNYPDLFLWLVHQFDALIGQFPVEIEIKDTDLTQEGDQSVTLKIANIAEGISELFGLAFQSTSFNDGNFNILLRMIPEIVRIRQLGLTNQDILIANRDFLGYKEKEIEKEIQSNFTILKDSKDLAKMLESETQKYKSIEFDDQDSLIDYLLRLQFVASLTKQWLVKNPDLFQEFINNQENDSDNLDNWNEFLQTINDPTSPFNFNEKSSRVRDVE